ncbi:MAG: RIP metalloprotease RseP [Deltaproteobacteria bacterium]|nr:RIP metalloprotease RseP [Deltaproteobacteria bacterium]
MIFTIVSFLVVLSILVFLHELGHYLAARHVGVRVERFSVGFPPRAFARTIGETEYVLAWIPLGGYVKLFGQNIDDEDPSDPRNFAAKTKLQRLYILVAGPLMNLAAALVLMPLVYMIGMEVPAYHMEKPMLSTVEQDSRAMQAGFRPGDRILALEEQPVADWKGLYASLEREVMRKAELRFLVERDGTQLEIPVEVTALAGSKPFGWRPLLPAVAGGFSPVSPAREAGLTRGDRITAIDGVPVEGWEHLSATIQKSAGTPMKFRVQREDQEFETDITARQDSSSGRWLIGITPDTHRERHGLVESVTLGTRRLLEITGGTFSFLSRMFSGEGSLDALGGPVKIGVVIGEAARSSFSDLIFLMALISLQLGIFNLLPIPALDGGHILLLAVEAIKRGPLSAKLRERTQIIGFSLLITLILVVTYNDVLSLME